MLYFACLMIVGDLTAGAQNQLKEAPSRYYTSASPKIPQKFRDQYFARQQKEPEEGPEGSHRGTWPRSTSGPRLGPTWWPWVASGSPLSRISPL